MGDDAIGALEIPNVKILGLRSRIMVSVCSGKAALAEVMGLSDVEERCISTQDKLKCRGQTLTFAFFTFPVAI